MSKNYSLSTDVLTYPSFVGKSEKRRKKQKQKQKEQPSSYREPQNGVAPRDNTSTGRPKHKESSSRRSIDLFWDIVGRDNYTTSLNSANVVCNTSSPSEKADFFQIAAKKFGALSWRSKKPSPRREPTMVARSDDRSLTLVTTLFNSRASQPASPSITSNTPFDWQDKEAIEVAPSEIIDHTRKEDKMPKLQLVGRKLETEPVLDDNVAEQLREQLPRRLRLSSTWTLLYSLDQDGTSIITLFSKVKDKGPLMLAIKDNDDMVFGAFVTEAFKPKPTYYGTGECFLWKCVHTANKRSASVRFYMWTGRNEYLILSEQDYIAIGGGDGRTGLWIDSNLEQGTSVRCDTFNNDPLSSSEEFECMGLEIWGVKN